jgi:hypothetical protein
MFASVDGFDEKFSEVTSRYSIVVSTAARLANTAFFRDALSLASRQ